MSGLIINKTITDKESSPINSNIANIPVKSLCCSPLKRAVETKDIISKDFTYNQLVVDHLKECSTEVWNNLLEIERGFSFNMTNETIEFCQQVSKGLTNALKSDTPLIIAHGGVYWMACYLMQIENLPWRIENCGLIFFEFHQKTNKWVVNQIN